MKRTLGLMAANWLRRPENQAKLRHNARQLWSRFQQRGQGQRQGTKPTTKRDAAPPASERSPGGPR